MILTGPEIEREVAAGRISIDPFRPEMVGPNSVDLHLGRNFAMIDGTHGNDVTSTGVWYIDSAQPFARTLRTIQPSGFILFPGKLYLASTEEVVGSEHYVPLIEGRSSIGRLGVGVHMTAGVGDLGFKGTFTLEITTVVPVKLYPGQRICQVLFFEPKGDIRLYQGRYQGQIEPVGSRGWDVNPDFLPNKEK